MATEKRVLQHDLQEVPAPSSDAYEVYWSATENETPHALQDGPHTSFESLHICDPGDAYNQLWQIWDAQ